MRLTTDFWISALLRQVRSEGAYAYLTRRGAAEAGTIFIVNRNKNGLIDLYAPAPQSFYDEAQNNDERLFIKILTQVEEDVMVEKLQKELRFDSDLWLVEIDDFHSEKLPFRVVDYQ